MSLLPSLSVKNKCPSRFLVTGGAGFIGHRTVTQLLAAGVEANVAVLDNLSVGLPMNCGRDGLATYIGDIRDRKRVDEVIAEFQPDAVIHLAAVHHIPTCERQRSYALDVNVVGTETVLQAAEAAGVMRFTLASSGAVYDWTDGALGESSTPLKPRDNYSVAKYTNEQQLAFWADRTGGCARIARIFNTIGHDDPNAHLIPDIVGQIPVGTKSAEIKLGNLSPRRDYIHADDTARAIATIACDFGSVGIEIYNVASGVEVSVRELVSLLATTMGVELLVLEDQSRMRRVDRPSQLGSTLKIEQRLGFKASKSLQLALGEIVRHVRKDSQSA